MKTAVDDFTLLWNKINPVGFFLKKSTRENKTFLPQLHFFRNMVGKVGEMAKVINIFFEKCGPLIELIGSHKIFIHVFCKSNLLNNKNEVPRDKNGMKCATIY